MAEPAKTILSEEQRNEIARALNERRVGAKGCPMCSANKWALGDGYVLVPVQNSLGGLTLGGQSIPSATIICTNCGFVSHHALGVLGLLPPSKG